MLRSNTSKHRQTISTAQKVTERIGDLALAIMTVLGDIGSNVMVIPGCDIETTLKRGYLESAH